MMSKKSPQLRFEGFTDDWEERKLGDYIIQYSEKTKQNNQYPVFTSSRNGVFFQKDYYKGNQIASEDNIGYNIVPRGYFTYRHMSDDLVFKFNINDLADYGIVSTLYPVFTTNEQLNSKYLQYQLNEGSEFRRFSLLQKQGGSRTYMYLNKLQNMILNIPKLEEQQKIGSFFKQLDDTIALHQRKLDLLKEQKKGYLQKMFPKNGAKVPELRFAGFVDDWELRKFDECFNFPVSTNSLSRALLNYDEGDIKSVHYGDILIKYPAILNIKNDKIPYITGGKLEKYKSSLLENGDLIFADAAEDETVGKAVEVNGLTEENLVAGLHTIVARPKDKKAEFFLGYYINSNTYHRQLLRLIQGSKVSSISKGNLQKTLVFFPKDFEEQQKIGAFFKKIDEIITLHQRKLDLLKEQKKGFLQTMFAK